MKVGFMIAAGRVLQFGHGSLELIQQILNVLPSWQLHVQS